MYALSDLESKQQDTKKMEQALKESTDLLNDHLLNDHLSNKRTANANKRMEKTLRNCLKSCKAKLGAANKSNRRAEENFIAMFLEAVEVYLDKYETPGQDDRIFKNLKKFFREIGNRTDAKALVELVLQRNLNSLCLDGIIRSSAVPNELDNVLNSSKFFTELITRAQTTNGGAEDAAGAVLAIELFGLGDKEVNMLRAMATRLTCCEVKKAEGECSAVLVSRLYCTSAGADKCWIRRNPPPHQNGQRRRPDNFQHAQRRMVPGGVAAF